MVLPLETGSNECFEINLLKRLDDKRKQIDAEIAEYKKTKEQEYHDHVAQFKKVKEQEYQEFTVVLRETSCQKIEDDNQRHPHGENGQAFIEGKDTHVKMAKNNRRKHRQSQTTAPVAIPPNSQEKAQREILSLLHDGNGNRKGQSDMFPAQRDVVSSNAAGSNHGGSPNLDIPTLAPLDRETDFIGVFSPGFLPLIDIVAKSNRSSSDDLLEALSTQTKPSSMTLALRAKLISSHQLSSSAEYHHSPITTSPPQPPTRLLSSSVPEEQQGSERDGLSPKARKREAIRRRSSLRDPNAIEPKSPKKVLFNIDNKVVSPSTSPIAKRENENTRSSTKTVVPETGQYQVVKNKPLKQPSASGTRQLATSLSTNGPSGWTGEKSPLRWTMVDGELKNSSPDDFVSVGDENDMFTFDEELDAVKDSQSKSEIEGKFSKGDLDDGEDLTTHKPLTGSSPHAGSLPIEIKWPGRRGSRESGD